MIDLKKIQKDVYQNKLDKGWNVTDVNKEFCLTYGEVAEAYEAWRKKQILNVDLETEILKKVKKNKYREYKMIDGVNTRVKEYEEK